MTPPPINIDGTNENYSNVTIDGQDVEQITIDGQDVLSTIPDSVVDRDNDDDTVSDTASSDEYGIRIETSQEWPSIGCKISANCSGFEDAIIRNNSNGNTLKTVDVSGLTNGDTFTFNNVNLSANTKYNIVFTASSSWDSGYYTGITFPNTSPDGNLSIINGIKNGSSNASAHNILEVGNVGF